MNDSASAAKPARVTIPLNIMAPLHVWMRLLWEHGGPDTEYRKRLAKMLLVTAMHAPRRLAERPLYRRHVARVPIDSSPLFILGCNRSGTTHLHNLMAQDPRLGSLTNQQAMMPGLFLSKGVTWRRLQNMPEILRPMDNMKVSANTPQEEEIALSNMTHRSFMHCFSFPRSLAFLLHRYSTLDALSPRELAHWERLYLETLRKAAYNAGGKRLVLKSPGNMGRIPHLLRLFPEARFIHIIRSPYTIYNSLVGLFTRLTEVCQLQATTMEQTRQNIEQFYIWFMRKYLEDRDLIPDGRLVEVRYEDLERRPVSELERIYRQLGIEGWDDAHAPIEAYLKSLEGYHKNVYPEDPSVIARVDEVWRFAVDEWQYQPPAA